MLLTLICPIYIMPDKLFISLLQVRTYVEIQMEYHLGRLYYTCLPDPFVYSP